MKTTAKSLRNQILNVLKQSLYALQVMIIALAIPVLSYMEVSHVENSHQNSFSKNTSNTVISKSAPVAYNEIK